MRAAIAEHYAHRYELDVPADQVVVTTGSSGGFLLAFLAAFDPGDRVAMARPGYPCYRNILSALGCEVVELPCGPQTRYQPTVAMLEQLDAPVRGLVLASPANPTGTVIDAAELAALAGYCERTGIQLVSDEIYHGISFPGAPATARRGPPRGRRSGQLVLQVLLDDRLAAGLAARPAAAAARRRCLAGNFTVCPPSLPSSPRWVRSRRRATPRPTRTSPGTASTGTCCWTA